MTTVASQIWCIEIYSDDGRPGWARLIDAPVFATQGEAEHAMSAYAPTVGRKAIRTAVFKHEGN